MATGDREAANGAPVTTFFPYRHSLTLRTTLAHAHSTHRLTGVHGSAHRLNILVMHKLDRRIFFSMYILNLGSTTATNEKKNWWTFYAPV